MNNIKKRVTEDTLVLDDRTFLLTKFDPLIGNYILATLMSTFLPFGFGGVISSSLGVDVGNDKSKPMLDKKSFIELQRDILSYCFEILPGNKAPVVNESGYGINDFSSKLAIQLIISVVAFNFSDFFEGSPLESLNSILSQSKEN